MRKAGDARPAWTGISDPGRVRRAGGSCRHRAPVRQPCRGVGQTGQRALRTEHLEGLEQRRPDPPAGHGHPDRRLGLAQLAPDGLGHARVAACREAAVQSFAGPRRRPWRRPGSRRRRRRRPPPSARSPGRSRARPGTGSRPCPGPRRARPPAPGPPGPSPGRPPGRRPGRPRRRGSLEPGAAGLDERLGRQGPDVLAVHVGELGHVEEGGGVVDVGQGEPGNHLVAGEDLGPVVRRAPAEQAR